MLVYGKVMRSWFKYNFSYSDVFRTAAKFWSLKWNRDIIGVKRTLFQFFFLAKILLIIFIFLGLTCCLLLLLLLKSWRLHHTQQTIWLNEYCFVIWRNILLCIVRFLLAILIVLIVNCWCDMNFFGDCE